MFGYSRALTDRLIPLVAVAKNSVVSYTLDIESLMGIIERETIDIEYFHELRHRMELLKKPETMEAPQLIDSRQHYTRGIFYLILRNLRLDANQ